MKPEKITVSDLFDKSRRFIVPIFQRGYVWTPAAQLKPLWRDIIDQSAYTLAHIKSNGESSRSVRKHFLGAVVLSAQNTGVRHVPISDVIDGQQRITTLQILLTALRDILTPLEDAQLSAMLKRWTINDGPVSNDEERYKVWPTNAFQEDIQAISEAGSAVELRKRYPLQYIRRKPVQRPLLVQAYLFFYDAIAHFLGNEEEYDSSTDELDSLLDALIATTVDANPLAKEIGAPDLARAELLIETITKNFHLVEINLEPEDDPQVIFETLNARGAPLLPSDLVRNFVFLYATRNPKGKNAPQLYEAYWKDFDETPSYEPKSQTGKFWKDPERQGRNKSRSRLDLFFYHFLTMESAEDFKIEHIFQQFREHWLDLVAKMSIEEALARIQKYAKLYRGLLQPKFATSFDRMAYCVRTLDTTTFHPVIMFVMGREKDLPDGHLEEIFCDLQSYLMRRAICGKTPKNFNRIALQLLLVAKKSEPSDMATNMRAELLSLEGDSTNWPDDEEFKKHFVADPLYKTLRQVKTRMVLEGLEMAQHSSKQEVQPIENPLEKPLTVEHVMPQTPRDEDWPPVPRLPNGDFDAVGWLGRQNLTHNIGNLTLLTQSLNGGASNGPFSAKRGQIARQSRLSLNAYFQDFDDGDEWGESAISARATSLFTVAVKAWPRKSV